jgi:hypothetical protein
VSARLIVGGRDLSTYLRLQPDDSPSIDPLNSPFRRPQFSGAPAITEGAAWVGDALDNRTQNYPLYLTANTRAEVETLAEEIDALLVKGAQVEFCIDPSIEASSFFDLERGTLDADFNYFLQINNVLACTLSLVVRPYAHTATHRLVASIPAATSAVVKFAATGILGNTYSLANFEVRVGSQVASNGRVVLWGIHPHPSHNPYRAAETALAQANAKLVGASGAIGSQYLAIPVSPTGASGVAYRAFLDPVQAHVGRHRVIAIGRSGLSQGIPLYAEDRFGAVLGATAIASQTDQTKWQIIDLGEVNVPARASGQESVPTQYVNIYGGGASGASVIASGALHLNGVMFLPLDYSAGILRTPGGAGAVKYGDSFVRGPQKHGRYLEETPQADIGGVWSKIAAKANGGLAMPYFADFLLEDNAIGPCSSGAFGAPWVATGATALYSLASGVQLADVHMQAVTRLYGGVPSLAAASNAHVALYPKMLASGAYVKAVLNYGPSPYVAIIAGASAGAANLKASAGMPSMLASGIFLGQRHTLTARVLGGRMDVWLATGAIGASPIISASHAELGIIGNPAVDMQQGPGGNTGEIGTPSTAILGLSQLLIYAFGASTSDIGAREWFRFESHPEGRVYQGNASVFQVDRLANYRGQFPKVPAVGSPAATGPARVVVLQGEVDNLQGLDGPDIALTVLERYRFLR